MQDDHGRANVSDLGQASAADARTRCTRRGASGARGARPARYLTPTIGVIYGVYIIKGNGACAQFPSDHHNGSSKLCTLVV